jgi:hypothetical protein
MMRKILLSLPVLLVGLYDVGGGVVIVLIDQPMTFGTRLLGIASALLGLVLLGCVIAAWYRPARSVVLVATWTCAAFVTITVLHFVHLGIMNMAAAFATGVGMGIVYALLCLCLRALLRRNVLIVPSE